MRWRKWLMGGSGSGSGRRGNVSLLWWRLYNGLGRRFVQGLRMAIRDGYGRAWLVIWWNKRRMWLFNGGRRLLDGVMRCIWVVVVVMRRPWNDGWLWFGRRILTIFKWRLVKRRGRRLVWLRVWFGNDGWLGFGRRMLTIFT